MDNITATEFKKYIKTRVVEQDKVQTRLNKGYTADLVGEIEKALNRTPDKAYEIRCEEPLSPRHLANVLRQRMSKGYKVSYISSDAEKAVWITKSK